MPATFTQTKFPEVVLVTPKVYQDDRGFFFESFKQSEFAAHGLEGHFVQENYSFSVANVIRGLHFQRPPKSQLKLVRVVAGEIWDVVVDIRPKSPSFGRWHGEFLSSENCRQLYIPAGFAHGFKVVSDGATVLYRTNAEYAPELEGGILWNDSAIAIPWQVETPVVSERDQNLPSFETLRASSELDCFSIPTNGQTNSHPTTS